MSFPLLTVTAAVPAVGAILTAAVPAARRTAAKWLALLFSLATLALAVLVAIRFDPTGDRYQLTESRPWIADFGVRYELGVDGIGVVLIGLTALLIPFVIAAGWHDADPLETRSSRWRPTQGFFALILLVEAMVIISFEATDVFLFYIFFEAMLIPMYFLIGGFGDRAHGGSEENAATQRSYAAVKFLLYNLVGGLIMLAAVIGLYVVAGNFSSRRSPPPGPRARSTCRPTPSGCCSWASSSPSRSRPRCGRCTPGCRTRWASPPPRSPY